MLDDLQRPMRPLSSRDASNILEFYAPVVELRSSAKGQSDRVLGLVAIFGISAVAWAGIAVVARYLLA
jgi:hypothetical protein